MRILVVHRKNFGYHVGTYFLCKYASQHHDVTFIGLEEKDLSRKHAYLPQVKYIELQDRGSRVTRQLRFLRDVSYAIRKGNYDLVFLGHFRGCALLKCLHPQTRFIFDVRTGSIEKNRGKRWLLDRLMLAESYLFRYRSVISESLREKLGMPISKTAILPLGADIEISLKRKTTSEKLRLLYIGTLNGRHLDNTIYGLKRFVEATSTANQVQYNIIGDGRTNEIQKLQKAIRECKLEKQIQLHGYIPRDSIKSFLENADIGISYVPICSFYDVQPVTKTFEYLLAGIPVLATQTSENKKVINESNGVLINDSPESFANGLKKMTEKLSDYNNDFISKNSEPYRWQNIIENNYINYMSHVCNLTLPKETVPPKAA